MKTYIVALFLLSLEMVFAPSTKAQDTHAVYTKAAALNLIGQAFPVKESYHRVDTSQYRDLPSAVKRLLTHGAGLAVSFTTNSSAIAARWCVTKAKPYTNMTAIANKGLDLYIKRNGKWQFAGVARPDSVCSESVLVKNMDASEKECLLYLPLYDEIKNLEIGVDAGKYLRSGANPFGKRLLIYGSSIVQGASASRPGMAYPARLSRETGLHFLNLGLSGSAKMEKEAAHLVAAVEADAYILDCVPNSSPEQITERTAYLIQTIRAKHPDAPIIVVESLFRESGYFDKTIGDRVRQQNINIRTEVAQLQRKGVKGLYIISADNLLGNDHEGTVDGAHPNDLGFERMLQILNPRLRAILKGYGIIFQGL